MDSSMTLALLKIVGNDPYKFIMLVVLIGLVLWVFKEIKRIETDDNTTLQNRMDKTLEVYGVLEYSISMHLKLNSEETLKKLHESFGAAYSYATIDLIEKFQLFFDQTDRNLDDDETMELLKTCREFERVEVKRLKVRSLKLASSVIDNGEAIDKVDYFMSLLYRLVKPVGITILISVLMLIIGFFTYVGSFQKTWQNRVWVFADGVDWLFFILGIAMAWSTIVDRKFTRNGVWILVLAIILMPILSLVLNSWWWKVIPLVIMMVVIFTKIVIDIRKAIVENGSSST